MVRLRSVVICACLGMACSSGDASPGSTAANTTTGSGPTTFSTFSTTVPPTTAGSGSETTESAGDTSSSTGSESSTSGGTVADASTDTGSGLCPSSHVCMEAAPRGWSGPVAVHRSAYDPKRPDPEAPCGEAYPDPATGGFEELLAEPASCDCSCADPNGVACDNSTVLRYWGDDATCGVGTPQSINIFASACNTLPIEFPADGNYSATPLQAVGGACAPSTEETLEPALWSWRSAACEGAAIIEDAGCAAGRECAPRPEDPEAALCIWQDGEHECPDAFDSSRILYGDLEDGRGCETCSCSAPNGLCDDAVVSLWNGPTCLVPAAGVIEVDGECQASSSSNAARAASLNGGSPNAFCVASEPAPSGEAIGIEPVTVCCVDLGSR